MRARLEEAGQTGNNGSAMPALRVLRYTLGLSDEPVVYDEGSLMDHAQEEYADDIWSCPSSLVVTQRKLILLTCLHT
jgi:hypothetical protein